LKVSIITVVFNGVNTINSCIESVLKQDYPWVEYIVIDGNSTDGTQEAVRAFGAKVTVFKSEPDRGIYDAMNKGIDLATGDLIGILNADDFYPDPTIISSVVARVNLKGADGVYGDLEYVDTQNLSNVTRKWVAGEYRSNAFLYGWMPPHPTFFVKSSCYQKHGKFRLDMGSAADYELMLRMIHKAKIQIAYLPKVLVKMRAGGVSNSSFSNRLKANRNDKKAWKVNNLSPLFFTLLLKPLRKLGQFF
jgi:glycosyltransferase involved in cell wall biosynthesis